jgi:hypothetical protein
MSRADSPVLILAADPTRRPPIVAALRAAGFEASASFVAELSDLVFAVVGHGSGWVVIDLQGLGAFPPPVAALLRNLAPQVRLVAVAEAGAAPSGFDRVLPLAGLAEGLRDARRRHGD